MTRDEFIAEYHIVAARALQLSEKTRKEGLLAIEEEIDYEKWKQRDIFEYGLLFMVDGTDASDIRDILENIIQQEDDKYTRQLMVIKCVAALSIQAGDNPRILVFKLNALTDLVLADDPVIKDLILEDEMDRGALSQDEINELLRVKGVE
jgi:flagellar motor component MotA